MPDLKRMRLLCNLRQIDLSVSTGVPVYRISGAETGRLELSDLERRTLFPFLVERWESISGAGSPENPEAQLQHAGVSA